MKINVGNMYTYIDYEYNTLIQEKVHGIMHNKLGVKVEGSQYSPAYKRGFWDGITDFYDYEEDRFHTGLLPYFLEGVRELIDSGVNIEYEVIDTRPKPLLHQDSIDEVIELGNGDEEDITLRDYQYDAVKYAIENQVSILNLSTNAGKCVPETANLHTSEGIMTMGELIQRQGLILTDKESEHTYEGDIKLVNRYGELEKPSHITFNGVKPLKKITTDKGTELTQTGNHPLLVVENDEFVWKETKDIKEKDLLVSRLGDNVFGNNQTIKTEQEAYVLGAVIADGYIGQRSYISVTNNRKEIMDKMREVFEGMGANVTVKPETRYESYNLYASGRDFVESYHRKYGLPYGVAKDKNVPDCVMQAPKSIQLAFLSGYIECECEISLKKSLEVTSASKELLTQIQVLYANLGIVSRLSTKVVKGYEHNYYGRLSVSSYKYVTKLLSNLTFATEDRSSRVKEIKELHSKIGIQKTYRDTLPNGKALITAYKNSLTIPSKEKVKFKVPLTISRDKARRLINAYPEGDPQLKRTIERLVDENLFYQEVVGIEGTTATRTYDLSMPITNSFVANTIINHNTETAAGILQQMKPYMKRNEKMVFFCNSREIYNQSMDRLSKRLNIPKKDIGQVGGGKFDVKNKQFVMAMIPTLASALKDPKKGVKFTPKERVIKFIAEEVQPKLAYSKNTRSLLRNYIKNSKLTTKVWESALEHLQYIAYDKKFTDRTAQMQLNKYVVELDKIIEKKNKKKFTRYQNAKDFVKSVKVAIHDECLVGGTQVMYPDGGWEDIENITKGEQIVGGEVTDIINRKSPITKVTASHMFLEGSMTHPTFIVRKGDIEGYREGKYTGKDFEEVPFVFIEEGDYLPLLRKVPHTTKTKWTAKQLRFTALIMADGHLDKEGNRVKVNVKRDQEWYLKEFQEGVKSFNERYKVKHSYDNRGNLTVWTNDKELKKILEEVFEIPRGKKSDKIKINKEIQYAPIESIKAFLEMYATCEGDISVHKNNEGWNYTHVLNISTVSKKNAIGLSNLIRKLGIISQVQTISGRSRNRNDVYRLSIGGIEYNEFIDKIGISNRKDVDLEHRNTGNHKYKNTEVGDYVLTRVNRVEHTDIKETVYDFTTTSHTFNANGVLTHNCHEINGDTLFNTMSELENAQYRVGLTGTIDTKNEMLWTKMRAVYGEQVMKISNDFLIQQGVSSRPIIRMLPIIEPKSIEIVDDYLEAYRLGIVENEVRNNVITQMTSWFTNNKQGGVLISVNHIEHGERLEDKLLEQGVECVFTHGGLDDEYRAEYLDRFSRGDVRVLIASSILDQGVDVNSIGALMMAGGNKSLRQNLQRIGRGLRINNIEGNTVQVFDFIDKTNSYLLNHSKERMKIYKEESFEVKVIGD